MRNVAVLSPEEEEEEEEEEEGERFWRRVSSGIQSFEAWDLTIEAPEGLKPALAIGDDGGGVVVVGQGECELAFGS